MGKFEEVIRGAGLSAEQVLRRSATLERKGQEGRARAQARWKQRQLGEKKDYAGMARPPSGRGVSERQWEAALADRPLPGTVRGKLLRAVQAVLARRGLPPVDAAALFGTVPPRPGPKAKGA
ncbi:MAG: hypothetical protein FJ086_01580 [Deltaproteobacteria bacterium]|nr:hypothetical protein [Deltaproteobacteria bacterium]